MDRRGFILASAGAVAALTAPACASVAMTRVTPTDGTVRLTIRSYPQLAGPAGYLRLAPEGAATPVYLLVLATGGYAAVSPICTHLGCTVGIEGSRLVCPCHGSTYDREGKVLRGPAERPLLRYPLRVSEQGDLVISLEGAP